MINPNSLPLVEDDATKKQVVRQKALSYVERAEQLKTRLLAKEGRRVTMMRESGPGLVEQKIQQAQVTRCKSTHQVLVSSIMCWAVSCLAHAS